VVRPNSSKEVALQSPKSVKWHRGREWKMVQARGKEISNAEEEGRKGQTTAFMVMAPSIAKK
jgi:hypothetical protein